MVLLVDIGNSNIVFGFSDKKTISNTFRLKTFTDKTSDEYYLLIRTMLNSYEIEDVMISSVVPIVTSAFKKVFQSYYGIDAKIIGPGVKTGVSLKVDDPKTVGADMICDCAGALPFYNDVIIVDLGTATKYIYFKNQTFLGCSIAPGVSISLKSLVSSAALLPNVELVTPKKAIGTNTISCIQSGVVFGAAAQVDGMIDRIIEEIHNPNIPVIATGGLSRLIVPLCKHKIYQKDNLTLDGLLKIYKKNMAA